MSEALYLIRKGGAYYRPNSQGYTRVVEEAGRYTLEEAEAITHPNGSDGPRDGMDYVPAPPASTTPSEPEAKGEAGAGPVRCSSCDGTGDLIRVDGEWIGWCPCGAAANAGARLVGEAVAFVMQYGGRCRDCGDCNGYCQDEGLPCNSAHRERIIRHVLEAVEYGRAHGFLARPVEEPGEVERLTRERDAQYDENVNRIAAEGVAVLRAEAAEAALAESEQNAQGLASDLAATQAELDEMRAALVQIEGGHFPGAADVAISGSWQVAVNQLQGIARAALTGDAQEASPMEKLGKFGWHPDPVIDFEVEIEKLESRFDCAMRGTSKPGERAETVQAVHDDIRRAMTFKAGGTVEGVVAKNRLRELEAKAIAAPAGDA